jgi:hypothetical protein
MAMTLRTSAMAALLLATLASPELASAQTGGLTGEDPVILRWPNRIHRTLQEAVDAVPDGGTLRIAQGTFQIPSPIVIRDKRLHIQGAGCAELRPSAPDTSTTHLAGPRAGSVVPAAESVGLFNFVRAGGSVRGLALSGFDAGVRGLEDEDSDEGEGFIPRLAIENTCISNTGRGIAWSARNSLLVENVRISQVSWNGISVFPSPFVPMTLSTVAMNKLAISGALNACIVLKDIPNVVSHIQNADLSDCGFGGILLVNMHAYINQIIVASNFGPGIVAIGSGHTEIAYSKVTRARKHGILFQSSGSFFKQLANGEIRQTQISNVADSNGLFGDGLTVFDGGGVYVSDSYIQNSTRAGVSNFGSFVSLERTWIQNAAFELEGEPHGGSGFTYDDRGGNLCGPFLSQPCVAVSVGLSPPAPIDANE